MLLDRIFFSHGHFCASHPWEVIVGTVTLTICMLTMGGNILTEVDGAYRWQNVITSKEEIRSLEAVFMTATRCLALLYIYHQFRKLWKLGSKYMLGISGLFAVFSSLVFSSSVVNLLHIDFAQLHEAWPFFLLLIDLPKTSHLVQLALGSSSQMEVRDNIAQGMAKLGPIITLDTLVETLVIGVGTLSGVKRLELVCFFACASVLANYLVFMSFFPACLSLVLELAREREGRPLRPLNSLARVLQDEEHKQNPVLQRVKVIMSVGLMLVHVHSRWPMSTKDNTTASPCTLSASSLASNLRDPSPWTFYVERWITPSSPDQLVMLILCIALIIKYMFFENDSNELWIHKSNECDMHNEDSADNQQVAGTSKRNASVQRSGENLAYNAPSESKFIQTDDYPCLRCSSENEVFSENATVPLDNPPRSLQECIQLLNKGLPEALADDEVLLLAEARQISCYHLEKVLNNPSRGVAIRRRLISQKAGKSDVLGCLPYKNYDYTHVLGACCENVIGYLPVPVGVAGPLLLDGKMYYVPMATTEGCLVASTNRGCRALTACGGVQSSVVADAMTRGPVVRFSTAQRACEVREWLEKEDNFRFVKDNFDTTSNYARLQGYKIAVAARYLFIRFRAHTGDAMGMNMLTKGTEFALVKLKEIFPDMEIVSLSGNYCSDKKPAAVNWIEGRGKSVVCEAIVSAKVVREVLKTSVQDLVEKNISKNLVGSAMAGSIGGFNAQAANIVTALYIATGQDPAQNVTSSNCLTLMEAAGVGGEDLYASVTMPSIEIGTTGGGTVLPPQSACLELMGVRGPCKSSPGRNAATFARIVCATVLAGELSLMSALASGDLVRSHMQHNRHKTAECTTTKC